MMKKKFILKGVFKDKEGHCWILESSFLGVLNKDGSYTIKVPKINRLWSEKVTIVKNDLSRLEKEITVVPDDTFTRRKFR